MLINADQNHGMTMTMTLLIRIDRHWDQCQNFDRHWSALGIDQGSPVYTKNWNTGGSTIHTSIQSSTIYVHIFRNFLETHLNNLVKHPVVSLPSDGSTYLQVWPHSPMTCLCPVKHIKSCKIAIQPNGLWYKCSHQILGQHKKGLIKVF